MKKDNTAVIVITLIIALLLSSGFFGFGMMGFGGYCGQMMNYLYGNTLGYISTLIIQILIIILLIIGILWLAKKLQK